MVEIPYKTCRFLTLLPASFACVVPEFLFFILKGGYPPAGWPRQGGSPPGSNISVQYLYLCTIPVVHWYFWSPWRKKNLESIKNHKVSTNLYFILRLCQRSETASYTTFRSFRKRWTKHLIKLVVYWNFWSRFGKGSSDISKHKVCTINWSRFTNSGNIIKPLATLSFGSCRN